MKSKDPREWEHLPFAVLNRAIDRTLMAEPSPTCDKDIRARLGDLVGLLGQDGWTLDHPWAKPPVVTMELIDLFFLRRK